jgi:hypothetical protein
MRVPAGSLACWWVVIAAAWARVGRAVGGALEEVAGEEGVGGGREAGLGSSLQSLQQLI